MSNTWKLESVDISGVGKAPDIEFVFADDNRSFEASPPGGHIRVEAASEGALTARIVLTNTLTGEVFADIEAKHIKVASIGDDWNDPAVTAGEIGASLYWSMWRMQQVKAAKAAEVA